MNSSVHGGRINLNQKKVFAVTTHNMVYLHNLNHLIVHPRIEELQNKCNEFTIFCYEMGNSTVIHYSLMVYLKECGKQIIVL